MSETSRPRFSFALESCVCFDVEAYPDRWMVGFLWPGPADSLKSFAIDGDVNRLRRALRMLARKSKILIVYNSTAYDVPMMRAILGGRDPYQTRLSDPYATAAILWSRVSMTSGEGVSVPEGPKTSYCHICNRNAPNMSVNVGVTL